jgi:hypothetical protein
MAAGKLVPQNETASQGRISKQAAAHDSGVIL